ncbi:Blp family class II bacteriocin [Thermoanaerobacter sp. A7A]|jgi:hypothetical protein|uniref:Blp family class II bacteriocin n=1 Tax=Thermoanaerobacter sp. A7A TaxID=1350366 RepID=UPI0004128DE5|nr:Blp family class II bacteriocin [Thermoanaerobacter sp. A7A]
MEAVMEMDGFTELKESDLITVDGGGPAIAMYPVDWGALWKEVRGGFITGAAGGAAKGDVRSSLIGGIVGAIAGGIKYYFDHPWLTYLFIA